MESRIEPLTRIDTINNLCLSPSLLPNQPIEWRSSLNPPQLLCLMLGERILGTQGDQGVGEAMSVQYLSQPHLILLYLVEPFWARTSAFKSWMTWLLPDWLDYPQPKSIEKSLEKRKRKVGEIWVKWSGRRRVRKLFWIRQTNMWSTTIWKLYNSSYVWV